MVIADFRVVYSQVLGWFFSSSNRRCTVPRFRGSYLLTIVNLSIPFNYDTWFKEADFSERSISSGDYVPSDSYVLFMEYSPEVIPSEVLVFISEMLPYPLVGLISSDKSYSWSFLFEDVYVLYNSVWKDVTMFMVSFQIIGMDDVFSEVLTVSIHAPYIIENPFTMISSVEIFWLPFF